MRELKPDVVFIALHGPGGEDGTCKRCSSGSAIPYTGSGLEASALAMDKHLTKKLLAAEGLPTPLGISSISPAARCRCCPGSLDLPLVVKPRFEGSSAGVVIVQHARAVDQSDDRRVEELRADSGRRVHRRARILVRRCSAKRRCRSSRSSPNRDEFYTLRREVRAGRQHARRARADRRRSGRAPADARAVGAPAARAARLLAHRFHRHAKPARTFSRSTRCPA